MRQRHLRIARTGGAFLLMLALLLCLPAAPARAADSQWRNIVDVVAGEAYTAALRDDGQVLYAGRRSAYDPFEAEKWTGVERLELTDQWPNYLVGYFRDGSVRVGGPDDYGTFDLSSCRDVAQVKFSGAIAAVLHRDGRVSVVLAGGEQVNSWDREAAALFQQRVPQWRDIVQVCFAYGEEGPVLVGLRRDGTLACTDAAWEKAHKGWDHVEQLFFTYLGGGVMALRRDGTLLATGGEFDKAPFVDAVGRWTDIAALFPSCTYETAEAHIVGLRMDGTLVAAGNNECGQCDVNSF